MFFLKIFSTSNLRQDIPPGGGGAYFMESRLRYLRLYVELVSFFVALVEELGDDEVSGTQLDVPRLADGGDITRRH